MNTCPATGKIEHASRDDAHRAMVQAKRTKKVTKRRGGKGNDDDLNVYRCSFCGAWHWGHRLRGRR